MHDPGHGHALDSDTRRHRDGSILIDSDVAARPTGTVALAPVERISRSKKLTSTLLVS